MPRAASGRVVGLVTLLDRGIATIPVLGQHRPPLVIAPLAVDEQVPGRKTFPLETKPADEAERRLIAWLDVGFQPVQAEAGEGVSDDGSQPGRHQPTSRMGLEPGIAEVARSKRGANDVVDVDVADEAAADSVPDQVAGLVVAGGPVKKRDKPFGSVWRRQPGPVQRRAADGGRDELVGVGWRRLCQRYVHVRPLLALG